MVNRPHILHENRMGPVVSHCNFPIIDEISIGKLADQVTTIFNEQDSSFRLNATFGYILRNLETGQFGYLGTL